MNRPHILHIMHTIGDGGVELATLHQIERLLPWFTGHYLYPVFCAATNMETIDHNRVFIDFWRFSDFISIFPTSLENQVVEQRFRSYLRMNPAAAVHFRHLGRWGTFRLPLIAREMGCKVVLSLPDYFIQCPNYTMLYDQSPCGKDKVEVDDSRCISCLRSKWISPFSAEAASSEQVTSFLKLRERAVEAVLSSVDKITVDSSFAASRALAAFGSLIEKKLSIVPLPTIVTGRLKPSQGPPAPKLRVAFLGNFTIEKGAEVFMEAVDRLMGTDGNKHFEFSAIGSIHPKIATPSTIRISGPYKHAQLPALLSEIDVVVIPPIWPESYCNTAAEAQFLGVPVVASRIGALSDRIIDGETGLFFRPGDPNDLVRCLRQLNDNRDLLTQMKNRLQSGSLNHTSGSIHPLRDFYRELLQ